MSDPRGHHPGGFGGPRPGDFGGCTYRPMGTPPPRPDPGMGHTRGCCAVPAMVIALGGIIAVIAILL